MFNIRGTEQLSSIGISSAEYLLANTDANRRRDRQKREIYPDFSYFDDCTQYSLGTPEWKKDRLKSTQKKYVALW